MIRTRKEQRHGHKQTPRYPDTNKGPRGEQGGGCGSPPTALLIPAPPPTFQAHTTRGSASHLSSHTSHPASHCIIHRILHRVRVPSIYNPTPPLSLSYHSVTSIRSSQGDSWFGFGLWGEGGGFNGRGWSGGAVGIELPLKWCLQPNWD